jgi:tRNA U38,U39,U40 pseudouridine synthase TruA
MAKDNEIIDGKSRSLANLTPGGPGRPAGQRNYATIYRDALNKIAAAQGKTPEEIETMMLEAGIKHSIKGNHKFHAYMMDKIHGKTPERHVVDMTVNEPSDEIKELAKKLNGIG